MFSEMNRNQFVFTIKCGECNVWSPWNCSIHRLSSGYCMSVESHHATNIDWLMCRVTNNICEVLSGLGGMRIKWLWKNERKTNGINKTWIYSCLSSQNCHHSSNICAPHRGSAWDPLHKRLHAIHKYIRFTLYTLAENSETSKKLQQFTWARTIPGSALSYSSIVQCSYFTLRHLNRRQTMHVFRKMW